VNITYPLNVGSHLTQLSVIKEGYLSLLQRFLKY